MQCLYCHHKIEADSKYCIYCGKKRMFDLIRSKWILIGSSIVITLLILLLLVAGNKLGLRDVMIALAPGLAWSADVLLKWAFGLSTRSSGADLTFGAFSASAVLLVIYPSSIQEQTSLLFFGTLVLGFLWLFSLVLAAIAEVHEIKTARSIRKLAKYIYPDHAMWFSLFLGFISAFVIAYLILIFGG